MKNTKKKKQVKNPAPRCPYCGSHTILRSADGIYLNNKNNDRLYVCSNYPKCDSYVRVIPGTAIPLGTVADRKLRILRKEAHRYFDRLQTDGHMTKEETYLWLAGKLGIPGFAAHIGQMGEYSCKQVITLCKNELAAMQTIQQNRKTVQERAAS